MENKEYDLRVSRGSDGRISFLLPKRAARKNKDYDLLSLRTGDKVPVNFLGTKK